MLLIRFTDTGEHDVDLGPYKLDFTASGRHMIAGGRKGHLALVDMLNMNLVKEIQV